MSQTYKQAAEATGVSERDLRLTIAGTDEGLIKRDDEGFEFTEEGNQLAMVIRALKSACPDLDTGHLWTPGRRVEVKARPVSPAERSE